MTCATENDSLMDSVISSLSKSFHQVPPTAIPSLLDCILATTGLSSSSLFDAIVERFSTLIKDVPKNSETLDSNCCNHLVSMFGAQCFLLKKIGSDFDTLQSFTWTCFIPFMKMVQAFDREIFNLIAESFFDVVTKTNTWGHLEITLVPHLLKSVGLSLGMIQNEGSDLIQWEKNSAFGGSNYTLEHKEKENYDMLSIAEPFPLSMSCHILTSILGYALQCLQAKSSVEAEIFAANLLWDLCNMTERLFSRSVEHRSCTIGSLFPIIFKTFAFRYSWEVSVNGKKMTLSRNCFFMRIWRCCITLFSLGHLERRDAYTVLSLYLSFFSSVCESADSNKEDKNFDLKDEKAFWDEVNKGLVDGEGFVRKQSLHILKMSLDKSGGSQCFPDISDKKPPENHISEKNSKEKLRVPSGMTKRELWADKEAKSLGVGKINSIDANHHQFWEAFIHLYEMLEEYGTHLVEAAWNHQVALLLQVSVSCDKSVSPGYKGIETPGDVFRWLSILWERGFCHDNPQVRCMILQSFLDIQWSNYGSSAKLVPESFVLGSFMEALNDPVHHKNFGVKGVYSSKTIEGASWFFQKYIGCIDAQKRIAFLRSLACLAKHQPFGRAGFMALVECTSSASRGVHKLDDSVREKSFLKENSHKEKADLLDVFRFLIESSKQHFNPMYRLRVCEKVLEAAAVVVCVRDVPLEILLYFIASLPREFTDDGGPLRLKLQEWLIGNGDNLEWLLKSLQDFPKTFTSHQGSSKTFDDDDLSAWEYEAKRWARVFFLVAKEEDHLVTILKFIQSSATTISTQDNQWVGVPTKFLILVLCLILEIQVTQERQAERLNKTRSHSGNNIVEMVDRLSLAEACLIYEKFSHVFLSILEELISFTHASCYIFWNHVTMEDVTLPGSIRGRLGGPSQRRLPASTTTAVLQAITAVRVVALILSWSAPLGNSVSLNPAFAFLSEFLCKCISCPTFDSEGGAEICLAAYEALGPALKALSSASSTLGLPLNQQNDESFPLPNERRPLLDSLIVTFLQSINNLLAVEVLARSRRAALLNWKWICLESLLSIPYHASENGILVKDSSTFFTDAVVRCIFDDLVESLENTGESSVLPMLRSVRLVMGLFASGRQGLVVSSCTGLDTQMMWRLVRSSWVLHISCNKRRVAPIAALLSSVLHSSVFNDKRMHVSEDEAGPLKWFIEKVLEEGTKSPRTIRLAALHLTGLWLSNPGTIKYYINELKLLTLYGSVQFDEDFEAELTENHDAKAEVSLLAKYLDRELTEAFLNTELYARVSVAVLFYKLADMIGSGREHEGCQAAIDSGKLFLLDLLDSAINDKDLSKELYKKYSGIHRRKIRAWQMICVLSRFVDHDIIGQVTQYLHISLFRNNLPAVRQYLETFAINIYLKFPTLVTEQLVPILRDCDMKPQALSSYVFIAANVILHASKAIQASHLDEILPAIIPLLTSHHHSLRGFTQLLVYQVFLKLFPELGIEVSKTLPLEKRCFQDLKLYLEKNPDCKRLRSSMEGYLEAYNPHISATPAGIFVNRVEDVEFECVATSLLDQVLSFLNDVREDLRSSMAKDNVTLKNENLSVGENPDNLKPSCNGSEEKLFNFQKKITLTKHEQQGTNSSVSLATKGSYQQLAAEIGKEDELLDKTLQSRRMDVEKMRASRQQFIIVASLLDRIPNLAGLARTCEVFKASELTIADASVLRDKQFQLISVTAEKWVPIIEVPVNSVKQFLEKKKREGFSILGLEQTANSILLDQCTYPKKTVLVLGREKEGIPVDIIHMLDACIEIPQLGVVRSLNVHVSGAIALWEYTRQQRTQ
ncbi:hypothetical protein ACFE04_028489 [Oxalis oulophora]